MTPKRWRTPRYWGMGSRFCRCRMRFAGSQAGRWCGWCQLGTPSKDRYPSITRIKSCFRQRRGHSSILSSMHFSGRSWLRSSMAGDAGVLPRDSTRALIQSFCMGRAYPIGLDSRRASNCITLKPTVAPAVFDGATNSKADKVTKTRELSARFKGQTPVECPRAPSGECRLFAGQIATTRSARVV